MEGADESTELWWHPLLITISTDISFYFSTGLFYGTDHRFCRTKIITTSSTSFARWLLSNIERSSFMTSEDSWLQLAATSDFVSVFLAYLSSLLGLIV